MSLALRETAYIHALHSAAWLAVRLCPPLTAKRLVDSIGALLPAYRDLSQAREAANKLKGRGACLSRALTIASRTPGAEVVIAVDPRQSARLDAHAWASVEGVDLEDVPMRYAAGEIARLR